MPCSRSPFKRSPCPAVEPNRRIMLLAMIAEASGTNRGMIGGQVADIEAEGKPCDHHTLEYISPLENRRVDSRLDRG